MRSRLLGLKCAHYGAAKLPETLMASSSRHSPAGASTRPQARCGRCANFNPPGLSGSIFRGFERIFHCTSTAGGFDTEGLQPEGGHAAWTVDTHHLFSRACLSRRRERDDCSGAPGMADLKSFGSMPAFIWSLAAVGNGMRVKQPETLTVSLK